MLVAHVGRAALNRSVIPYPALYRGAVVSIALICLAGTQVVRAQEASSWETVPHGAARLNRW